MRLNVQKVGDSARCLMPFVPVPDESDATIDERLDATVI